MIIKNRGLISRNQVIRRPKSSIPQKDTSVHHNLQLLYSKKNMLENNVRTWESKLATISYELEIVNSEISKLEKFAKSMLDNGTEENKVAVSSVSPNSLNKTNIKVIDFEY